MSEIFRHSVLLVLVITGFYLGNLRGAILGMLLTEFVVLSIGIWWGKSYFCWGEFRLDFHYLTPFLRFGLIFFIVNLLSSGFQYSGEVLVRLFYPDYVQVGYFGLANNVYLTIARAVNQITISFAPLMVTLLARGETTILKQWIKKLIKWLTVGGVFVVFSVLLLGDDLVPLVLGATYKPVAMNLVPFSMTLWAQVLGSVAILIALVYDRPKIAMTAGIIRLAAIWGLGPFFIAQWGSLGGCFAVLVASAIHAGYLTWRMQESISYSLRRWLLVIGAGGIFLPLVWLRSSGTINFLLYGIFAVGYLCILLFSRIITRDELVTLWQAIGSNRRTSNLKLRER
jgi:O-antigen/teichoic acid export membrane protein